MPKHINLEARNKAFSVMNPSLWNTLKEENRMSSSLFSVYENTFLQKSTCSQKHMNEDGTCSLGTGLGSLTPVVP